jgi:S-adenosylmethionine synthetase
MVCFLARTGVAVWCDGPTRSVWPSRYASRCNANGATAGRNAEIEVALHSEFWLTPAGIMRQLDLLRSIYFRTAADGHFWRDDIALPWEALC